MLSLWGHRVRARAGAALAHVCCPAPERVATRTRVCGTRFALADAGAARMHTRVFGVPDLHPPPTLMRRPTPALTVFLECPTVGPCRLHAQVEERTFHSKYCFKDISGVPYKRTPAVMVDYDGKARVLSEQEKLSRSWASKYSVVKRADVAGLRSSGK